MNQDQNFTKPGIGMPPDLSKPHVVINGRNTTSKQILMDGATEGHVLVKNKNNTLPLKSPRLLSLFGYSAKAPDQNNYVNPYSPWILGEESGNGGGIFNGVAGTGMFSSISLN